MSRDQSAEQGAGERHDRSAPPTPQEGLRLIKAFERITDPQLRLALVEHAERLAALSRS
jgi:hypothetical protein